MIKYAELPGYKNLGEVWIFSHVYQFLEAGKETPMTILIHAYECDTKVFKGYLFKKDRTFKNIPLTEDEIKALEIFTGKLQQVGFDKFVIGTILENDCQGYTELP